VEYGSVAARFCVADLDLHSRDLVGLVVHVDACRMCLRSGLQFGELLRAVVLSDVWSASLVVPDLLLLWRRTALVQLGMIWLVVSERFLGLVVAAEDEQMSGSGSYYGSGPPA